MKSSNSWLLDVLRSPVKVALVVLVLVEVITEGLIWLINGGFSIVAFFIAAVCSFPVAFFMSTITRRYQRALREKNRQLKAVALQLQEANARLEEHNVELDAFAHTVAHDLQSPISLLVGFSRLLAEHRHDMSSQAVDEHLRVIWQTGERMTRIVDELLVLSSVRALSDVEVSPLDMVEIIGEVRQRLDYVLEEYGAEMIVRDSWPVAVGHRSWVEQVWMNYISNALKYGGRPPRVELGASSDGNMVRYWVRDNGPGVRAKERVRLFNSFTRLEQTRAQGYGLGLSIVRRIVKRLGGEVGVESEPGEGSTFYFTLPSVSSLYRTDLSESESRFAQVDASSSAHSLST